ncbi:MAG TPA: molecular chaperone DnaJ [Candidatus Portnoybacteria bacterium]|nr:molecular chaperone DnaJ [Candidatus Portnoybacteria bacterium]
MAKDYYEILGVSREASEAEIKKSYRKLAHQYHPDKKGGDETRFKEVNEAYQILGDKEKRAQYNQFGSTFEQARDQGGFSGFEGFRDFSGFAEAFRNGGRGFTFNSEDLEGFGDIFSDIFSARGRASRKPRGQDISIDLEIDFEEAVKGTKKEIKLTKKVVCSQCQGRGAEPGTPLKECPSCGGSGQIHQVRRTVFGSFSRVTTCPECQGEGEKPVKSCRQCRGEGRARDSQKIKINIPAGIDDGQIIKLGGQGEAALKRGISGDLYLTVHVKEHRYFKRQGNDILYQLPLSFTQAALGDKIEISTLDGPVKLKIPAGIQSGKMIRLKDKGIPYLGGRGDQLVEITVKTPKKLSRREKKILEDLAKEKI